MALPVYLQNFKAAGIYRVVFDKSTILGTDAEILRLVVGYSEQGPFNTPVYITSITDFKNIFGDVSKKLEKRGIFFHRTAIQCLSAGPILALNLKKFSDETVDGVSISSNYFFEHTFNENIIDTVKLSVEDLYDTTRFWSLDATKLPELKDAENGRNLRNYINIAATNSDKSGVSYFIRKANGSKVSAYNVSVSDWYKDSNEDIPEYLEGKENNMISDFFAEIYVFNGEFKKDQVMSSETLKKYFEVIDGELQLRPRIVDAYGDAVDTLDYLYTDESAGGLAHYIGALIPYFKDKQNVYRSLDIIFNQDIDTHHLMMSFDIEHLTDPDEEGKIHNIDLSGKREVTNGMLKGISEIRKGNHPVVRKFTIPMAGVKDADAQYARDAVDALEPHNMPVDKPKFLFGEEHLLDDFGIISIFHDITTRDSDGNVECESTKDTEYRDKQNAIEWQRKHYGDNCVKWLSGESFEVTELQARKEDDGVTDVLDEYGNVIMDSVTTMQPGLDIAEIVSNLKTRHDEYIFSNAKDYYWSDPTDWLEFMIAYIKYFIADAVYDQITNDNLPAKYIHSDLLGNINSPIVIFKTEIGSVDKTGTKFDLLYSKVESNDELTIVIHMTYPDERRIRISVNESNKNLPKWLALRSRLSVGTAINSIDFKGIELKEGSGEEKNDILIQFTKKSSFVISNTTDDIATTSENINTMDLNDYVYDPSITMFTLGGNVTFAETAGTEVIPTASLAEVTTDYKTVKTAKDNTIYDTSLAYLVAAGDIFVADAILEEDEANEQDYTKRHDIVFVQEVNTDEEGYEYVVFTGAPYFEDNTLLRINDSLNKEIGVMKPKYLAGYVYGNGEKGKDRPASSSMYDKLQWHKNQILSALTDYKGLRVGLKEKSEIDYRYIIDTFETYVDQSAKKELCMLAKEKQSAFAILNFPAVRTFVKCPYTSFVDDKGIFNVKYVVKGYNPKKAHSLGFSLPTNDEGASFCAFYTPLKTSDGYIDNIVPSAGVVSNLFMEKYMSRQPYYIVAGPNHGVINMSGLVGPDYNYSQEELNEIEPYGVNCMVYRPSFGTFINANQTAKQTPKSALSSVNVRELVIYLQDEIEKLLQSYQWEFNNATVRNKIKDRADVICTRIQQNGGIQDFINIMDESNNTPEIIDNEMAILSTHIEPGRGMGKMVHELTIYRTGQMRSVISE